LLFVNKEEIQDRSKPARKEEDGKPKKLVSKARVVAYEKVDPHAKVNCKNGGHRNQDSDNERNSKEVAGGGKFA
jgi:hypothetical protein